MKHRYYCILLACLWTSIGLTQNTTTYPFAKAALTELQNFFSLPNDANQPEQLEPNIKWCESAFGKRGFQTERLATAGIDLLLAEYRIADAAAPTVLFYVQVDGQPVDDTKWEQKTPFTPTLKKKDAKGEWQSIPWDNLTGKIDPEWRVFARSASDAKGPIVSFLAAWDALRAAKLEPPYHIKIIMDNEEELGSPNLPPAVEKYRTRLAADHLVILDGPPHISNRATLVYGARGIATVRLTVYGPREPLHSGHYGNYAPNPAMRLAQLLAGTTDDKGRVTIPGWYDGITISDAVKKELAAVPDRKTEIDYHIGISEASQVGSSLQEAIQYPSLNVRGLYSGWVGRQVRTIIPAAAVAEIDIRLVKESDPGKLINLLRQYIQDSGYTILEKEPTEKERHEHPRLLSMSSKVAYAAFRTPLNSPTGLWLERALQNQLGEKPVKIRTHGGSVPISPFVETLQVPAVIVPLVNPDNNQHSPNENLRLGNYFRGAEICYGILTTKI